MPKSTTSPLFRRMGWVAFALTLVLICVGLYGLFFSYSTDVQPDVAEQLAELKRISWMCIGVGIASLGVWLWARGNGYA